MDINLKSGWQEITLAQYLEIKVIYESALLNDLEREIKVLIIVSGIDDRELNNMSIPEFKTVFKSASWLEEETTGNIQDHYTIEAKKYTLIKRVEELNAGQFIDLCVFKRSKSRVKSLIQKPLAISLHPFQIKSKGDKSCRLCF